MLKKVVHLIHLVCFFRDDALPTFAIAMLTTKAQEGLLYVQQASHAHANLLRKQTRHSMKCNIYESII